MENTFTNHSEIFQTVQLAERLFVELHDRHETKTGKVFFFYGKKRISSMKHESICQHVQSLPLWPNMARIKISTGWLLHRITNMWPQHYLKTTRVQFHDCDWLN